MAVINMFSIPENCYVMYWIRHRTNPSLVDSMIYLDCLANIGTLLEHLVQLVQPLLWQNVPMCLLTLMLHVFFVTMGRIIHVTVAIYRYILVCQGRDNYNFFGHCSMIIVYYELNLETQLRLGESLWDFKRRLELLPKDGLVYCQNVKITQILLTVSDMFVLLQSN